MLRMASHDIGRPLNEIIQMLELMTDFDLTEEEHRQYIQTIRRAAQNIDDIISDLIAFDRVESEVGTRFERASAAEMIHEAIEDLEGAIKMKGHAFTDEIAGDLPILYANRLHIRRAMENLLSNAIKYTPDGGRIVLRARTEGERFIFEVEDNGYGIPANKMHRLYERFGRLKQPGTGHIPGTGLGLSLVKTVVEAHGGEPYISSIDGEGTISGFWLPIREES
jgi:signal transduction histidine kinase